MSNEPTSDFGWWNGSLALGPPPREIEADLVVVGLGGSGLAAVHAGLDRGLTVVGIDAGPVAGGAAGRNGGFLLAGLAAFHHDAKARWGQDAVRWYRATEAERERMIAETPACVRRVGSLRRAMSDEESDDCRRQLAEMRADGIEARWSADGDGEGVLTPRDAVFEPHRRARTLAKRALRRGARLFENTRAEHVDDGVVETAHGRVRGRHVVLATDGAAADWIAGLTTVRLQMLATEPDPAVRIRRAVYARWGYDYWQQRHDGSLFVGGGRDVGGRREETSRREPSARVQDHIEGLLRGVIGSAAPIRCRWAASVTYTADGRPRMTELSRDAWVVGGYSGTGNVVGSLLGRAAVETMVTGRLAEAAALMAPPAGP